MSALVGGRRLVGGGDVDQLSDGGTSGCKLGELGEEFLRSAIACGRAACAGRPSKHSTCQLALSGLSLSALKKEEGSLTPRPAACPSSR